MIIMNLFAIAGLSVGTSCALLAVVAFLFGRTRMHRILLLFNVACALWGFGLFFVGVAHTEARAVFGWRMAHAGSFFIAPLFFHLVSVFSGKENKNLLFFGYVQAILFTILGIGTDAVFHKTRHVYGLYFNEINVVYFLAVLFYLLLVSAGYYNLIRFSRTAKGRQRSQSLYIIYGFLIGFAGATTTFLPMFGVDILYPFGNFGIVLYSLILSYAILRYRLMDFSLAIRKGLVYSLSVTMLTGLYFFLVFNMTTYVSEMTGMTSFAIMTMYTLVIAVLFTPLKNRVQLLIDKVFYKTAYDYYAVVKKISHELASTIGLQLTYRVIVNTLFDILKLKNAYLLAATEGSFNTVYFRSAHGRPGGDDDENVRCTKQLPKNAIISEFVRKEGILLKDELPLSHDQRRAQAVADELKPFEGAGALPIFVDGELGYLLIFGEKLSADPLAREDLNLLTTIASQASIALKNAKLYHELEQRVSERTADLSRAIELLHGEIAERRRMEVALQVARRELELRVEERTVELKDANAQLVQEVVERKKVEQSVINAAEQWRATFDSMKDAIIMIDNDDRVVRVNMAGAALYGSDYKAITGKPISALFQAMGTREEPPPLARTRRSKKHEEGELYIPGKNMWALVTSDPVLNGALPIGTVCILTDITERKKAEEEKKELENQLLQTQKMESIGRLAGGIAHDFNNLLSAIIGYSDLSLMKLPEGSTLQEYVKIIRSTGEKAAGLTRQLLAFSRKQILEMKHLDLGAIVDNMGKILSRLIGEDIAMEIKSAAGAKRIKADEVQIEQIIMNLVVNGRDSMPKGGSLIIETAETRLDETDCAGSGKITPGPYVMLSVTDTGQGMTEEVKKRIFEPFFTTKEKGKGTGMGLATVYGIVMQHKGHIAVDSALGKGTTFRIYFPVADEAPGEAVIIRDDRTTMPRGNETILVVDDEPVLCKLVTDSLQPLGYHILQTSAPEEALLIGDTFEGTIDLILTDVVMPGMNGKQLADTFLQKRPNAMALYMSGYANDVMGDHGILEPGTLLIQKPLTTGMLAFKVRDALDRQVEAVAERAARYSTKVRPLHILLADDEKANRELVRTLLEGYPFTFDEAENGNMAVEMFRTGRYDLVLMDLVMPHMDGLAATREIRLWEGQHKSRPTPIIAVTGYGSRDDAQKCIEAGCTSHLAKPFRKENIISAIAFARDKLSPGSRNNISGKDGPVTDSST